MIDFTNYSKELIKVWISNNNICFVTNSMCNAEGLLLASLRTYIDYIPFQHFQIINGNNNVYGLVAFLQMLVNMIPNKHFDYIIYLDEDCFVTDFRELMKLFSDFLDSGMTLAGVQDGGVLCHRNHSKYLVNTFISFWNLKSMRQSKVDGKQLVQDVNNALKNSENLYANFYKVIRENKDKSGSKSKFMDILATQSIEKVKAFREKYFREDGTSEYADIVKNDPYNPIEPHLTPYSCDDETANKNYEPYYILEQLLLKQTKGAIYYIPACDLYLNDKGKYDFDIQELPDNGLSSMVMNNDMNKIIAVHTWYTRNYSKWVAPNPKIISNCYRINKVIVFANKLISKNNIERS